MNGFHESFSKALLNLKATCSIAVPLNAILAPVKSFRKMQPSVLKKKKRKWSRKYGIQEKARQRILHFFANLLWQPWTVKSCLSWDYISCWSQSNVRSLLKCGAVHGCPSGFAHPMSLFCHNQRTCRLHGLRFWLYFLKGHEMRQIRNWYWRFWLCRGFIRLHRF